MKNKTKLIVGKIYVFDFYGSEVEAEYMGRQEGFSCLVCDKGNNVHTFNLHHGDGGYETLGYGTSHLPEMRMKEGETE